MTANEHLRTDKLKGKVGRKATRGAAIVGVSRPLRILLGLGVTAALARYLTPIEFGLVGMVAIVVRFVENFKEFGLGSATVQREDLNEEQLNALFWINLGISFGLGGLLALASPLIAWFFDEARLTWITCGLALGVAFSGIGLQHRSLLRRQMHFGKLAVVDLGSFTLCSAFAISLAVTGASYWTLVSRSMALPLLQAGGFWLAVSWRPGLPRSAVGVGKSLRFGANLTTFNLLNFFSRNADDLIIGKLFGPEPLAAYQKAYDLMMLSSRQVVTPAAQIALPALSRLTQQPEKYKSAYFRIVDKVLLVTTPAGALLLSAPDWTVNVLLGSQWAAVPPLARMLGVVVLLQPLSRTSGTLLMSQDRTREMPRLGLISGCANLVSFAVGAAWGPLGIATAYGLGQFIRTPWVLYETTRTGPIAPKEMFETLILFSLAGAIAACATHLLRPALAGLPTLAALVIAGFCAAAGTYSVLALTRHGRRALRDVLTTIHQLALSRKKS